MNPLLQMLADQLGSTATTRISERVGSDPQTTARAVAVALPVLVGALGRNASDPGQAKALMGAIDQDHDGSILDQPGAHPQADQGAAILRHVLGDRQQAVADGVSRASGLDSQQALPLLTALAPLMMGVLGRLRRDGVLAPKGGAGELASVLGRGDAELDHHVPPRPGKAAGLTGILDADEDGQIADDIARLGAAVLGGRGNLGSLLGVRG